MEEGKGRVWPKPGWAERGMKPTPAWMLSDEPFPPLCEQPAAEHGRTSTIHGLRCETSPELGQGGIKLLHGRTGCIRPMGC